MKSLIIIFTFVFSTAFAAEPKTKYICRSTKHTVTIKDFDDEANITQVTKVMIVKNLVKGQTGFCLGKDNYYKKNEDHECSPSRALIADEQLKMTFVTVNITASGLKSDLHYELEGQPDIDDVVDCKLQ
ncbi:MAG: hypothetical protein JNM93_10800 [Bacteriovoracaceae bacterium]|nr:hypothetical protein [Bacteriovoracaceae bacterium]